MIKLAKQIYCCFEFHNSKICARGENMYNLMWANKKSQENELEVDNKVAMYGSR